MVVGDRSLIGLEQEMLRQLGREHRLTEALEPLLQHYDIVLIDTPPSLGIVSVNALVASDGILIPVQTEYFALEGLAMLAGTIREVRGLLNPKLGVDGVMLTMHAPTLLNQQVASEVREAFPELIVEPASMASPSRAKYSVWTGMRMPSLATSALTETIPSEGGVSMSTMS
jgi:chromosome partitioning protein